MLSDAEIDAAIDDEAELVEMRVVEGPPEEFFPSPPRTPAPAPSSPHLPGSARHRPPAPVPLYAPRPGEGHDDDDDRASVVPPGRAFSPAPSSAAGSPPRLGGMRFGGPPGAVPVPPAQPVPPAPAPGLMPPPPPRPAPRVTVRAAARASLRAQPISTAGLNPELCEGASVFKKYNVNMKKTALRRDLRSFAIRNVRRFSLF